MKELRVQCSLLANYKVYLPSYVEGNVSWFAGDTWGDSAYKVGQANCQLHSMCSISIIASDAVNLNQLYRS